MRREYTRTMSKNADNEHSLEVLSTSHPCFIDIFAVIYCYVLFEKMYSRYHRAFLSVKRRFLYLGILQSTQCEAEGQCKRVVYRRSTKTAQAPIHLT